MNEYVYNAYNSPQYPGIIGMIVLVLAFLFLALFTWWPGLVNMWQTIRDRNKIKSFVIKVKGFTMNDDKFKHLTEDINNILKGKKLPEVRGAKMRKLTRKNIISITTLYGDGCHYFIVWFRR